MKKTKARKKLTKRQLEVRAFIREADKIREGIAKHVHIPDDFDVVKFIHDNR